MVGLGKSISHTKASIEYGWNQEKDSKIVLKQNLAGETPSEITDEFKIIQSLNTTCKKNTLSFVLSPTIEDGKKLSLRGLSIIADEFIKDQKLEDNQAVAFVHQDKQHKHIHLYINRIGFDGKAYKDNFIGKRAQKAAERVALKLKLQTIRQIKEQKLENVKDIRKFIKKKHEKYFKSLSNSDLKNYITFMKTEEIKVKPIINKSNRIQGLRYLFKDINLKGSEIHRSLSINKLKEPIEEKNINPIYKSLRR